MVKNSVKDEANDISSFVDTINLFDHIIRSVVQKVAEEFAHKRNLQMLFFKCGLHNV